MIVGGRSLSMWAREIVHPRNYRALAAAIRLTPDPLRNVWRYLTASGSYPYAPAVRTPTGSVSPTLDSFHDMMTFNEIFLREDYQLGRDARVVRRSGVQQGDQRALLPHPRSGRAGLVVRAGPGQRGLPEANLAGFEDRYILDRAAVGTTSGSVSFNVEPTGRYGGIGVATAQAITVACKDINTVIANVLDTEPAIDLLKIDIEGLELAVVEAIARVYLPRIRTICFEWAEPGLAPLAELSTRRSQRDISADSSALTQGR